MKKHLLLSILSLLLLSGTVSAQTTGTYIVADKGSQIESCVDSSITLAQIISLTGIRDLHDPNDDASMYKMFELQGSLITTNEITGPILYSNYSQVFVKKMNATPNSYNYGLTIMLKITIPPTRLFKKDTLKYTVNKGAKVKYIEDFFAQFEFFSSNKDVLDLDERMFFMDEATGIETTWSEANSAMWQVGKGSYKLKAQVSVCTKDDLYYDSIYVVVVENGCLSLEVKNLSPLCRDQLLDITPNVYLDGHVATSSEISQMTFRNKSNVSTPAGGALLDPYAIDMIECYNDTLLYPKFEIAYTPNVTLGVCGNYSFMPDLKVPSRFVVSDIVFTHDNGGRQAYYMIDGNYYAFDNIFSKSIFKKTYIDNYNAFEGALFDFYTDKDFESPVSGDNLTAGDYYIVATHPDCSGDSSVFNVTIKNRDFNINWMAAESQGEGYYTFIAEEYPGATYTWMAWSGSIISGSGTNQLLVYYPEGSLNSPYVTCKITLNNTRTTGGPAILESGVYLTTTNGVKEEITEGITTDNLSSTSDNIVYAYPNPASETFAISGNGASDVNVYNTMGQLVYSNNTYIAGTPVSVSSKGLYIIHLKQQGKTQTLKVIVQ